MKAVSSRAKFELNMDMTKYKILITSKPRSEPRVAPEAILSRPTRVAGSSRVRDELKL